MDCCNWCNSAHTVDHHISFKASDQRKSTAWDLNILVLGVTLQS